MGTCLVTTLKEAVTDTGLLKLGDLKIRILPNAPSVNRLDVWAAPSASVTISVFDGYITDSTGTSNYGTTKQCNEGGNSVYITPQNATVVISNKYQLQALAASYLGYDFDDIASSALTDIRTSFSSIAGSLEAVSSHTGLQTLALAASTISGNISVLSSNTALTILQLQYCGNIEGDISSFAALTSLNELLVATTSVIGNIGSLTNLSLTSLDVSTTAVTGSLSAVANMTTLNKLRIANTSIAGDTSELARLTNLTVFDYSNCPNITGTWPLV